MTIYLCGVFIAMLLMYGQFDKKFQKEEKTREEMMFALCLTSLLSWLIITVTLAELIIMIIDKKMSNK